MIKLIILTLTLGSIFKLFGFKEFLNKRFSKHFDIHLSTFAYYLVFGVGLILLDIIF